MNQAPGSETIEPYTGDPTDPRLRTDPEAVEALITSIEQELTELYETLEFGTTQLTENKNKLKAVENPPPGQTAVTDQTPEELQELIQMIEEENNMYRFNIEELEQQLTEAKQQLTYLTTP